MTIVNPHLEGETRTGTLPLTSEVLLSDIALTYSTEMLFNIMAFFSFIVVIILKSKPFPLWIVDQLGLFQITGLSKSVPCQCRCKPIVYLSKVMPSMLCAGKCVLCPLIGRGKALIFGRQWCYKSNCKNIKPFFHSINY